MAPRSPFYKRLSLLSLTNFLSSAPFEIQHETVQDSDRPPWSHVVHGGNWLGMFSSSSLLFICTSSRRFLQQKSTSSNCSQLAISLLSVGVYRAYFHPLSKYPGPRLWAVSPIPFMYNHMKGRLPYRIHELHEQYGPVVRLAPTELSFITDGACNDIYMKPMGKPQLQKDRYQFLPPDSGVAGILFEYDDHRHALIRFVAQFYAKVFLLIYLDVTSHQAFLTSRCATKSLL